MKGRTVALLALLTTSAWAEDRPPPAASLDLARMGPWTRRPPSEAQVQKEVLDFLTQDEALQRKGEVAAYVAHADFPVYVTTDNARGEPSVEAWDRKQYVAVIQAFWADRPKDTRIEHRRAITVLSAALVSFTDDFVVRVGGQALGGRNVGILIKRNGQWLWKAVVEAGWGELGPDAAAAPRK